MVQVVGQAEVQVNAVVQPVHPVKEEASDQNAAFLKNLLIRRDPPPALVVMRVVKDRNATFPEAMPLPVADQKDPLIKNAPSIAKVVIRNFLVASVQTLNQEGGSPMALSAKKEAKTDRNAPTA